MLNETGDYLISLLKRLTLWRLRDYAVLTSFSVSFSEFCESDLTDFLTFNMTISVDCLEAPFVGGSCHVGSSHFICIAD